MPGENLVSVSRNYLFFQFTFFVKKKMCNVFITFLSMRIGLSKRGGGFFSCRCCFFCCAYRFQIIALLTKFGDRFVRSFTILLIRWKSSDNRCRCLCLCSSRRHRWLPKNAKRNLHRKTTKIS